MESLNDFPEKFSIEKTIEALKDNSKLIVQMKIKGNNCFISTKIKDSLINKVYKGSVSQQEIQKNRYFLQFETMEQILEELILKSKTQSPIVIEEHGNLVLKFFLLSTLYKEIAFTLKPKNKNNIATELKKENSELKQEINILKNEINQLKEQTKVLINFKNKVEEEKRIEEEEKKRIEEEKKNLKMDSKILENSQEKKNIIKEFISPNKKVQSELKYRMTRDGADFDTFHRLCDNISPNLLLIKDDKNNIFGGFTKVSWEKRDCIKNDPESFLFSINKNKKYNQKHNEYNSIFCYSSYGPWFYGGDIGFSSNDMSCCISYGTGDYLDESLSTNNPGSYFKVQEVEFYKIINE